MTIAKRTVQVDRFTIRLTERFKKDAEHAAMKAGFPSLSEFAKVAIIRLAAEHGVKIDRNR